MLEHFVQQRGDKGAKLLSTLQRYIQYCTYKLQPLTPADQQEVLQEVAIKLLSKHNQVQANCAGWLFTIVRNEYIDQLRRQVQQVQTLVESPNGDLVALEASYAVTQPSHENLFLETDCLEHVFQHIEQQATGAEDMQIYTQYALGESNEAIAAQTGRSVGAIAKRLSLLRERVRQLRQALC
jgi:DNA-directed RNA polymerase specialized sigma24 family protein